jgi:Flp pilus assembly protein TadG
MVGDRVWFLVGKTMLRALWTDRRGNFAMMTALTAVPLLGGLALGIDYSEMTRQQQTMQSALDASALATAKRITEGGDEATVKTYAADFFKVNLVGMNASSAQIEVVMPDSSQGGGKLKLTGRLLYKPYFMDGFTKLIGQSATSYTLSASSEVRLKNTLEVALVLDNSGSMTEKGKNSSEQRMDLLKRAAKQLVTDMAAQGKMLKQVTKPVQFAVVPFAASVNVNAKDDKGGDKKNASWMDTSGISPIHHESFDWSTINTANRYTELVNGVRFARGTDWGTLQDKVLTRFTLFDNLKRVTSRTKTGTVCTSKNSNGACTQWTDTYDYSYGSVASWGGCVEARPYPYNVNDTAPTTAVPASMFVPMFAPDETDLRDIYGRYAYNSWWLDKGDSTGSETNNTTRQRSMLKYFVTAPLRSDGSAQPALGMDDGPNQSCSTTALTPLTDVNTTEGMAKVTKAIDDMQAGGATNVPEGMAWGWRVLSSGEPFTDGRPETERGNDKVVIVLTDGANTYYTPESLGANDLGANDSIYSAYGYTAQKYAGSYTRLFQKTSTATKTDFTNTNYTKALNDVFSTLCGNSAFVRMSADGSSRTGNVIVMTIALDLNSADKTEAEQIKALKACASPSRIDKNKVLFWNATGDKLNIVFDEIANELSNLRIVG